LLIRHQFAGALVDRFELLRGVAVLASRRDAGNMLAFTRLHAPYKFIEIVC
jgi:hypothetical protein